MSGGRFTPRLQWGSLLADDANGEAIHGGYVEITWLGHTIGLTYGSTARYRKRRP